LDSNSPNVCWWAILTILETKLGSPCLENLYPRVLAFQQDQSRLKRSFITLDIVKNIRRGQTVTVQKQDSNNPNVCWWAILIVLEAEVGSSFLRELVASCFSFPMRPISLEIEFYNSRYS
jgi:hypothetical protein